MADGTRLGSPEDSAPDDSAPEDSAPDDSAAAGAPDTTVRWVPVTDTEADDADVVEFGGLGVPGSGWRRYRMAAAIAVGLVVAVGAVVISREERPPDPKPAAVPSATPVDGADLMVGPVPVDLIRPADERRLPILDSRLPHAVGAGVGQAVPLSTSPVARALALFQDMTPDNTRVIVLGTDGGWRWLDGVRLTNPVDADGNEQRALDATSLSPRGTRAAFAQRDAVVVVDLTTARSRRYTLAGYHEQVIWQPDENGLYLVSETRTSHLDIHSGRFSPLPYHGMHLVAAHRDSAEAVELLPSVDGRRPTLRRWNGPDETPPDGFIDTIVGVDLPGLRNWWGPGWRNGALIARATFYDNLVPATPYLVQAVAVVDANTGAVRRLLGFAPSPRAADRWRGCCQVLGWLSGDTVLVTAASGQQHRLLAWHIRTGDLSRVMDLPSHTLVALPDLAFR